MKKLLLVLFVLTVVTINFAFADPVDKEFAAKIALNFCKNNPGNKTVSPANITLAYTEKSVTLSSAKSNGLEEFPVYYIFNINQNDGFVIVSADNDATPLLGYTTTGSYTGKNLPEGFVKLMELYKDEIRHIVANQLKADNDIRDQWEKLANGQPLNESKHAPAVGPLMSTTWNQNPYENEMCPADASGPGGHCVTGCPATAMAQIMKYWNYPTTGTGFHSYNASNSNGNYGTLSADYGATTYDWGSMVNNLTGSNSAVALLMVHCGIAVEMNYGPNGSGGWVIENDQNGNHPACSEIAYKTYFGYAPTMQGVQRGSYNDATWKQMLKTDLDANRPIQYAGWGSGGHTFVCDGYDQNEYFHMNWGWGGYYDGFFDLDALNPGTSYYNSNQQAILGLQPGQSGGSTSLDLYSSVTVNPDPINYSEGFTVNADILNNGSANFQGDFCAALFTSDGVFVDYIQTLTGADLQPGYHYIGGLDFVSTGITAATPGNYIVGIYSRPTGGNWTIVGNGSYTNLINVTIQGTANNIKLYSAITLDHSIVVNQPFTASVQIANYDASDFSGYISLDLHSSDGQWIQAIQEYNNVNLSSGYYNTFSFSTSGLNVPPGDYLLVVWDQPAGGNMELVSSSVYSNPIGVAIAGQPLSPDVYEPNNTSTAARNLTVTFTGNTGHSNSDGSNIHSSDDVDYYSIDLPAGQTYSLYARLHDSYNSGNGQVYTADVMFNMSYGGQSSETYDDVMPAPVNIPGGGTLTFGVYPFFPGEIGTYLLEITRNYVGIEDVKESSNISVFPNPAKDYLTFGVNLQKPETISGKLTNVFGQQVMEIAKHNCEAGKSNIKVDVSSIAPGCYFYEIMTQAGKATGKVVIAR